MERYFIGVLYLISSILLTSGCSGEHAASEGIKLHIKAGNGGIVTVEPLGGDCGSDCYEYEENTQVTLIARPDEFYVVGQWSSSCAEGAESCSIILTSYTDIEIGFRSILAVWDEGKWGEMVWQ